MDIKRIETNESIFELLSNLNGSNFIDLQYTFNHYLKTKNLCEVSFLLTVLKNADEGTINVIGEKVLPDPCKILVPPAEKLEDVLNETYPSTFDHNLEVALSEHLSPFPQFQKFPIYNVNNYVTVVVCLGDSKVNNQRDHFDKVIRLTKELLCTSLLLHEERQRKEQCQKLLRMSKNLFLHLGDLVDLMQEITIEARELTGAERCSLFLVSDDGSELIARVFEGVSSDKTNEVRIPITYGLAGHVASTGKILNIKNVYDHPLFYRKFDELTGFRTKAMLVYPIRDGADKIVGVAELCNKKNDTYFTALDEEAATALATYCGISLMHSLVYKKIQLSQARVRLANELLMYHMGVTEENVALVLNCRQPHDLSIMVDLKWPCREVALDTTPCLTLYMFESLGFLKSCRMDRTTLIRFLLLVRKGYRSVPYHNWLHAFSVAHFVFGVMKQLDLVGRSVITELEAVSLLVSAICHDLDHRGTTNSFQTKSKNTLACLYSSEGSVMERHHFAQTLNILNTEGCNIFEDLDTAAYRRVLELMRDAILATDLATHLAHLPQQKIIIKTFDSTLKEHRRNLLSLLITSADLSDQVKGWRYSRHIATRIYEEFFAQGDMERAMGSEPAVMMDRNKADLPALQIQFLTDICLPCYKLLAAFSTSLECCVEAVEDNLIRWQTAKEWFSLPENDGRPALDLLNDPRLEAFVSRS